MELALKESNKLKKGRKKKEDRTESKKNQNGRSKGFDPFVNPGAFITEIDIKFRVQTSAENCRLGSVLSGPSS